ncbi:unnamed protein product [Cunninghamella blakesleeana]
MVENISTCETNNHNHNNNNNNKKRSILSLKRSSKKIKLINNNDTISDQPISQQKEPLSVSALPTNLTSVNINNNRHTNTDNISNNSINTNMNMNTDTNINNNTNSNTNGTNINNNSNNNNSNNNNNIIESFEYQNNTNIELPVVTVLGEYDCPICKKDLTYIKTSYNRQIHVEQCLTGVTPMSENNLDNNNNNNNNSNSNSNNNDYRNERESDDLFMNYCQFCGKDISKLTGIRKENHYDQCLNIMEKEQKMEEYIKKQEKLNTFAGQSLPFLQQLDICPSCHDPMKTNDLRNKISHIKKCIQQNNLSIQKVIQKIHWMQWGHLPTQKPSSSSLPCTLENSSTSISSTINTATQSSTFSVNIVENNIINNNNNNNNSNILDYNDNSDGFSDKVLIYKIATWKKKEKEKVVPPSEDEFIAMALSRSLMPSATASSSSGGNGSKKKNGKINLNVSNVLSISESKTIALKTLKDIIHKKRRSTNDKYFPINHHQFPLVVSKVKEKYCTSPSSSSTPLLWNAALSLSSSSTFLWSTIVNERKKEK